MQRTINQVVLVWFGLTTALCAYAASTFAEDVRTYDWQSLFFAALAGLVGRVVRWVVTNSDRGSWWGTRKCCR